MRVVRGSLVLAFLCACSSAGISDLPGEGSGGTSAGGSAPGPGAGGAQAVPGAGGQQTGPSSGGATGAGGSQTGPGAGGSETAAGGAGVPSGGSDAQPGSGGAETEPGTGGSDGAGGPKVTVVLAGDNVDMNGPLATTVDENLGFSGGGHILVRPTNITTEPNAKHPVVIWGPGGGTPPKDYLGLMTRMASHGFVVVGIRVSTGDHVLMSAAIDWLEDQNEDQNSPMYDRLILDRVGVFGHSMGGLSSEATALKDDRVATALLNNSGSFEHDALVNVSMPVGIIYGERGDERPNSEGDYKNATGPCWISMMAGGGHGSGPWDGAGANVAWMRWHIGGDNARKDAFLGSGGKFNNTGIWKTQFKNWDNWKNWNE